MGNFAKSHSLPTFEQRIAAVEHKQASLRKKWLKADKIVDQVYCDIANGFTNSEIQLKLKQGLYEGQTKGMDSRTIYDYINAAQDRMHYDFEEKLPQMREDLYLKFMTIYQECIEHNDRLTAVKTLEGLMKLVGIDGKPQTAIQINSDKENGVTINFGFNKNDENIEDEN